jgi:hypothetical protein
LVEGGTVFETGLGCGLVDEPRMAGKAREGAECAGAALGVANQAVAVEWEVTIGTDCEAAALE